MRFLRLAPALPGLAFKTRLALVIGVALVSGGCGLGSNHTLNGKTVDSQLERQLKARYPVDQVRVTCPKGVEARAGTAFSCRAILDGATVTLMGTVTSSSGRYNIQPSEAIVVSAEAASTLQQQISSQLQKSVSVYCGAPPLRIVAVGGQFNCTATLAGQAPRQVTVTVQDNSGHTSFSLQTS